jgi:hypothetical protein
VNTIALAQETIDEHIPYFFVQFPQLDPTTPGLESL